MTATEKAVALRKALKAEGWSAKDVSVRSEYFSLGSAVNVKVKSPAVSVAKVKELAAQFEHVRRCEMSGEILGGGNCYVSVSVSDEAEAGMAAPFLAACEAALAELRSWGADSNRLASVDGTRFTIGWESNRCSFGLWGDSHLAGYMNGAAQLAYQIAVRQ